MNPLWNDTLSHHSILMDIVGSEKTKNIVEIGVWKCGLTKEILKTHGDFIAQYWAIDSWKAINNPENGYEHDMHRYVKMTEQEWDNAYLYACKLVQFFPQLHIIRAMSISASKLFPKEYFDLVFIDADHRYDFILSDIKAWLPLVKKGGLLTGHDYKIQHKGTMRAVDECFGDNIIIIKNSSVWMHRLGSN